MATHKVTASAFWIAKDFGANSPKTICSAVIKEKAMFLILINGCHQILLVGFNSEIGKTIDAAIADNNMPA